MKLQTNSKIFAYSRWDFVPVFASILQGAYLVSLFFLFLRLPWWALTILGLIYSYSISWNINGASHNFIHNPFFRNPILNRLYSVYESLVIGFSQIFYEYVHKQHHMGNSDRRDEQGNTVDWVSIYRYGKNNEPENPWTYCLLGYFRDDTVQTFKHIKARKPSDAYWGVTEIGLVVALCVTMFFVNWKFMLYFLAFYYAGHCFSYLNGFYRHYGSDPDVQMSWGVSSYDPFYNWLWFNNGYHAEHHYRPQHHWTKMEELRDQIQEEQIKAGTRILRYPHYLGFLEPLNIHASA